MESHTALKRADAWKPTWKNGRENINRKEISHLVEGDKSDWGPGSWMRAWRVSAVYIRSKSLLMGALMCSHSSLLHGRLWKSSSSFPTLGCGERLEQIGYLFDGYLDQSKAGTEEHLWQWGWCGNQCSHWLIFGRRWITHWVGMISTRECVFPGGLGGGRDGSLLSHLSGCGARQSADTQDTQTRNNVCTLMFQTR